MKERRKRNLIIGILCCMVVFMGIGYATLQQVLTINSTGSISGKWNIEITAITPEEINEGVSVFTSIADSKVAGSFAANLKKPTDAVVYTVTVENKGTIDAVLESITPEDHAQGDIKYTTTGKEACKYLNAGKTCDFTIKVEYLDTGLGQILTPNGTEVKQEFGIKYVQQGIIEFDDEDFGNDDDIFDTEIEDSAFKVTDNGILLHYERQGDETSVVVPAAVDKRQAHQTSFNNLNNNLVGNLLNDKTKEFKQTKTSTDKIKIKRMAKYAFVDGDALLVNNRSTIILLNIDYIDLASQMAESNGMTLATIDEFGCGNDPFEIININKKITVDMSLPEFIDDSINYESNFYLTNLDLSEMIYLEEIGENTFTETRLTKIYLPNNDVFTTIGDNAFYGNNLTGELVLPSSLTTIGNYAFANNRINKIVFETTKGKEENLLSCGNSTFNNNEITEVVLNRNVLSTAALSPFDLHMIEKAIIGEGVTTIYPNFFYEQKLTSIKLPSTLKVIGGGSFTNNQISELTIPNGVTTIGDFAFSGNSISSLIIPDSVTTIGNTAFLSTKITGTLIIPNSVTALGASAFKDNCITNLIFEENSKLTIIKGNSFYGNDIANLTIPASVTTIEISAFEDNRITTLNFEEGSKLTTIREKVFSNNQISGVKLPESVTTIGTYAFSANNLTDTFVIPSSITTLGIKVFENNPNLTKMVIKRADSTGMTLETAWNLKDSSVTPATYYEVVWDPNYVG